MITVENKESGRKLTCKGCGKPLRYTLDDIETGQTVENYSGDKTEYYIICPCCRYKNSWWNTSENFWHKRDQEIEWKRQSEQESRMF